MQYKIHKEGTIPVFIAVTFCIMAIYALWVIISVDWLSVALSVLLILITAWVIYFFRVPVFVVQQQPNEFLSSADGKVVAVEQIENKFFPECKAWQISVFMSPFDTHMNRYPMPGKVEEVEYQKGKFLPAYHPKSSELNESNTIKMITDKGSVIWIRQIAGIMARRIVNYARKGEGVYAGQPLGFIKFGSRVDHFMPANSKIKVSVGQKVRAGKTVLAEVLG
ncbi:MAG: phosphatidylserine decarboxylase family protein [Bacteroidales bacterium]|nr:phosphatidylserine decarboxylase family protein [Bacteroidales bacterium]